MFGDDALKLIVDARRSTGPSLSLPPSFSSSRTARDPFSLLFRLYSARHY